MVVKECGCKDIALPGSDEYPKVEFCTNDKDIPNECQYAATEECYNAMHKIYDLLNCVREVKSRVNRMSTYCDCVPPCHDVTYDVTYSLSKWPAKGFDGDEAYMDVFEIEEYPTRFLGPEDRDKFELFAG